MANYQTPQIPKPIYPKLTPKAQPLGKKTVAPLGSTATALKKKKLLQKLVEQRAKHNI